MKKLINVILVICLFLLLLLGLKELLLFLNVEKDYMILKGQVVTNQVDNKDEIDVSDPFHRSIDFEVLNKINEEIAVWIYIPGTKVDYPVLIGDTQQEYLKKDFENKTNDLGSIFAFQDVELNQDFHVCLYGHNMISGQMFGGLKLYREEKYARSHEKAYLYTKERTKELEILSVFLCENTDEIFEMGEKTWEYSKTEEIVRNLKNRSLIDLEISKKKTAQIFTFATCYGKAGGTKRLVLNFGLIREKFMMQ